MKDTAKQREINFNIKRLLTILIFRKVGLFKIHYNNKIGSKECRKDDTYQNDILISGFGIS